MASFDISFTTLHTASTLARKFTRLFQFTDAEVKIARSNYRTAKVTVPFASPALKAINDTFDLEPQDWAYLFAGHFKYRGFPVFWGQCNDVNLDFPKRQATFTFRDPTQRLEQHFLNRADEALNDSHHQDKGRIPINTSRGLKLLRDAANNLPGQDARGVPVLGIKDGINLMALPDGSVGEKMLAVERGQQIWSVWQDLAKSTLGPDWDLKPLDVDTVTEPYYVQLDTYDFMGGQIVGFWDYGNGNHLLSDLRVNPTGPVVTHVHLLTQDNKRLTVADTDASDMMGIFVEWENEDFKSNFFDWQGVLQARGEAILTAKSHPTPAIAVQLRNEAELHNLGRVPHMPDDFYIGDLVGVSGKEGYVVHQSGGSIEVITLKQKNHTGTVLTNVDLVPFVTYDSFTTEAT